MTEREPTNGELLAAIERLRTDVMARLDNHSNALTALRDDIAVNMGRADRAIEVNKATRDEVQLLAVEVSAMGRQIQRLQTQVRELRGEG